MSPVCFREQNTSFRNQLPLESCYL